MRCPGGGLCHSTSPDRSRKPRDHQIPALPTRLSSVGGLPEAQSRARGPPAAALCHCLRLALRGTPSARRSWGRLAWCPQGSPASDREGSVPWGRPSLALTVHTQNTVWWGQVRARRLGSSFTSLAMSKDQGRAELKGASCGLCRDGTRGRARKWATPAVHGS